MNLTNTEHKLGIIVNPMSGRDVRRVAARASTSGHHEKQQQVTRLVLGALAEGAERIYLANEPFRINARAVENLPERDQVTILDIPLRHSAADTETMARMMWDEGCRVFIVLGGDGTSRIVARTLPDAILLPLSTGTNNVFPTFVEASVAGAAAGLIASGRLDYRATCFRCKQIHITAPETEDIAMIDAVALTGDMLGSYLPFEADKIACVLLARAEPASVGVSPIGGYLMPCHHTDDFGVFAVCGAPGTRLSVPVSPGLYDTIHVNTLRRVSLGEPVTVEGPCLLAFDGDRSIKLLAGQSASLVVRRDGPFIIETGVVMEQASHDRLFAQ